MERIATHKKKIASLFITVILMVGGLSVSSAAKTDEIKLTSALFMRELDTGIYHISNDLVFKCKEDGRLTGLTTEMEYRKSDVVSWSAVTVDVLSSNGPRNLEAGEYEVRYKETENAAASEALKLTIKPGRKLIATYKAETENGVITVGTQETIWNGTVTPSAINVPEREGYNSDGWSGKFERLNSDVTLTAIYSSKKIKVSLEGQGGIIPAGEDNIYEIYGQGFYHPYTDESGEQLGEMSANTYPVKIPSRTGYSFLGYYTNETGGECYIGADGTITDKADRCYFKGKDEDEAKLYAHWKMTAYEYKIVKASDAYVKVTGNDSTKTTIGYEDPRTVYVTSTLDTGFKGDSIYVYVNGELINTIAMTAGDTNSVIVSVDFREIGKLGNVLVSIGDEPVSHSIKYMYAENDLLAGSEIENGLPVDTPYVFLEKAGLSGLVTPVRNGYTFCGWYDTADCSSEEVKTIPARTRNDVILYAKWERNKYNVSFEANGGDISETPITQYEFNESEETLLPDSVSKEGFIFKGWLYI